MFHPVGPQPPSVYWRRRFLAVATAVLLLLLVVLTVRAMSSGATGPARPAGAAQPVTTQRTTHHDGSQVPGGTSGQHSGSSTNAAASSTGSTAPPRQHRGRKGHHAGTVRGSSTQSSSSAAPPPTCTPAQLAVQAVVGQSTYHVGDKPVVMLEVTNNGPAPCMQDLADRQIVLKVYNGESRVWGSHDCEIQPGTDDRLLAVGHPVRISITWSGLTSQPGCQGTRRRVGAGTYTLYGYLGGHGGKAAQFSIV